VFRKITENVIQLVLQAKYPGHMTSQYKCDQWSQFLKSLIAVHSIFAIIVNYLESSWGIMESSL